MLEPFAPCYFGDENAWYVQVSEPVSFDAPSRVVAACLIEPKRGLAALGELYNDGFIVNVVLRPDGTPHTMEELKYLINETPDWQEYLLGTSSVAQKVCIGNYHVNYPIDPIKGFRKYRLTGGEDGFGKGWSDMGLARREMQCTLSHTRASSVQGILDKVNTFHGVPVLDFTPWGVLSYGRASRGYGFSCVVPSENGHGLLVTCPQASWFRVYVLGRTPRSTDEVRAFNADPEWLAWAMGDPKDFALPLLKFSRATLGYFLAEDLFDGVHLTKKDKKTVKTILQAGEHGVWNLALYNITMLDTSREWADSLWAHL